MKIGIGLAAFILGLLSMYAYLTYKPSERDLELVRLQGRFDMVQSVCPLLIDKLGLQPAPTSAPKK